MDFKPNAVSTVIGSFPHLSPREACDLIFKTAPDIPAWPQLPRVNFYEDMINQYSKRLPCYFIDEINRKFGFDTKKNLPEELNDFYNRVLDDDIDYFRLDDKYSMGYSCFIKLLDEKKYKNGLALKGQITGPLSIGVVTDITDGKYAIYKPDIYDTIIKNCTMISRWQVRELKKYTKNAVIFIDEPSLSIIGSGYYSISEDLALNSFNEIIEGIKAEGGIAGMHCCGNANWDSLLKLDLDIINFDASDEIILDKFLNSINLNEYIEKGKTIAWGIVPTLLESIEKISYETVEQNFKSIISILGKKGIHENTVLSQAIITPSCGTGTLPINLCEKAMDFTKKLSQSLRGK